MIRRPPRSTLFPYTRSSDLDRPPRSSRLAWRQGSQGPEQYLAPAVAATRSRRSEEHTSELQSHSDLVCRLLLEKKKTDISSHLTEVRSETSEYRNARPMATA